MNVNEQYVIDLFQTNFQSYKEKNIFLYGIGYNTELIINNFQNYNIIGILDGVRKEEYLYGKYIYDINKIITQKPYIIIVIARTASTRIIKNRIADFCKTNNILLYDIRGKDLLIDDPKIDINDPYFNVKREVLIEKIRSNEAISFDIFDTLLIRKTLFPDDVFDMIEHKTLIKGFKELRKKAENAISHINPDISQIYSELSIIAGLSIEKATELMNMEIEIETKLVVPRKEIVSLMQYAISLNKKVSLISDMYLPEDSMIGILKKCDIVGYDNLFISCKEKKLKTDGLFDLYKKAVPAKNYLHIGDNEIADKTASNNCGIDCFLIKSPYDMATLSTYSSVIEKCKTLNDNIVLGHLFSVVFNNPFSLYNSKGKPTISYNDDISVFVAPIILDFTIWMYNEIKSTNIRNILFAARDGYLIQKCFKLLTRGKNTDIRSIYFLTSRIASMSANIYNDEDILYAGHLSFSGSPEDMLKTRFLLSSEQIKKYDKSVYNTIDHYLLDHRTDIINQSRKYRSRYLKYIETLSLNDMDSIFFDFASSGTTQMYIQKMINHPLQGMYFIRILSDYKSKQDLNIKSLLEPKLDYDEKSNLNDKYIFLETLLTSPNPTLNFFDEDSKPVYLKEKRNKNTIEIILNIHRNIIDILESIICLYNKYDLFKTSNISDNILGFLDSAVSRLDADYFKSSVLEDECCLVSFNIKNIL